MPTTKMSVDGKPARGHTKILTDSARKRNRKEVLAYYNKTWINIGHQHDRWMELKAEALRVQTHVEVPLHMQFGNWEVHNELYWETNCTQKNNEITRQTMFYTHVLMVYINFQLRKKLYTFNAACLAKKQQIQISYCLVWPERDSNPRSTAF